MKPALIKPVRCAIYTRVSTEHGLDQQFNSLVSDPEVEIRFKAAVFDRLRDEVYQLTHQVVRAKPAARSRRGGS